MTESNNRSTRAKGFCFESMKTQRANATSRNESPKPESAYALMNAPKFLFLQIVVGRSLCRLAFSSWSVDTLHQSLSRRVLRVVQGSPRYRKHKLNASHRIRSRFSGNSTCNMSTSTSNLACITCCAKSSSPIAPDMTHAALSIVLA